MQSLFQQIKAGQLWDFHGGIHPPARKLQTQQKPIGRISLPERLYVPLRQHIGVAGTLLVEPGDFVQKGQPLTAASNAMAVPVHAPTSGTVVAIEARPAAHPSALPEPCVIIAPDGLEQWRERYPLDLATAERHEILARIQQAGIAGMGGAGFPTHLKSAASSGVDYLIINAVECEPYITADAVLMQEYATTIVKGIDILCQLLHPAAVLIGIEDDKPDAIAAMQAAVSQRDNYLVKVVPAKYPSGGEKQLIQLLTSKEVPAGRRPLDIGIVMQNVGTAFAIAQAVLDDIPLISRIVTVVGETLSRPQNIHALIGTPVGTLLDACDFKPEAEQRVIMGGPMMGFTLPSLQVPLVKTTNCILAPTQAELPAAGPELDCIRCGACAEVCPAILLPQQLLWYSKAKDQDKLKEYNLADCIECGACAYVCPSEIPLVHYYRVAKAEIREQSREALKAEQAKARFEARNERLEREKQQRNARNQALAAQRQQQMEQLQKQREVAEAQARVQQRMQDSHTSDTAATPISGQPLSKEQIIAARELKKAEARAYQQAKAASSENNAAALEQNSASETSSGTGIVNEATGTPRADAVAAAIARAKAKKAQSAIGTGMIDAGSNTVVGSEVIGTAIAPAETPDVTKSDNVTEQDPRAAAVAAAIARAKAKKAQSAIGTGIEPAETPDVTKSDNGTEQDPRAAAVAAAIARAKAKKAQSAIGTAISPAETPDVTKSDNGTEQDPRAAAVAAAIARAKAKKAQSAIGTGTVNETSNTAVGAEVIGSASDQAGTSDTSSSNNVAEQDPKALAVAAAIARAKAKKAQQSSAIAPVLEHDNNDHVHQAQATTQDADIKTQPDAHLTVTPTANDAKATAIAAAIARAKAKKAQHSAEPKDPV